jgi:peptidoglycan hydrolase-like protein with peptidoglycan-binding domain
MTVLAAAAITAVGSGTALADTATNVAGNSYPYPVLKQGTKSENVRALQWLLNCHGYKVGVPSHFGPSTGHQVKAYQVKFGLMPFDGNVGAYTWNSILSHSQVHYGDRNDCVKAFQVVLNKFRHIDNVADLPITGYFGPNTRAAYRKFFKDPYAPAQIVTPYAWHVLAESFPNA